MTKPFVALSRRTLLVLTIFFAGILAGGYLFSGIQPRSVLAVHRCEQSCWRPSELLGLAGAVLMDKAPALLTPYIVQETDYNLAIRHPSSIKQHYVIIPKRDIRDMGNLHEGDAPYLADAMALMNELIRTHQLDHYRIWTNGPGHQTVNHLHFHLAEHQALYIAEQLRGKDVEK